MIRIKICGITRPEDARVAVAAGADAIGMVFAPSPRRVSVGQAQKIISQIPPFVLRVGVFVNQDPRWILEVAGHLGLDRIQFHGQELNRVMKQFPKAIVWRALCPKTNASLPKKDPAPCASAVLIDAYVPGQLGGTGSLANWKYAKAVQALGKPYILAGGLNPENVKAAIALLRPGMVDVSSGVEKTPGIKNPRKIRAFIRAAKAA